MFSNVSSLEILTGTLAWDIGHPNDILLVEEASCTLYFKLCSYYFLDYSHLSLCGMNMNNVAILVLFQSYFYPIFPLYFPTFVLLFHKGVLDSLLPPAGHSQRASSIFTVALDTETCALVIWTLKHVLSLSGH